MDDGALISTKHPLRNSLMSQPERYSDAGVPIGEMAIVDPKGGRSASVCGDQGHRRSAHLAPEVPDLGEEVSPRMASHRPPRAEA
jgi:hypothetical protein